MYDEGDLTIRNSSDSTHAAVLCEEIYLARRKISDEVLLAEPDNLPSLPPNTAEPRQNLKELAILPQIPPIVALLPQPGS
jgi:hypothetical protein